MEESPLFAQQGVPPLSIIAPIDKEVIAFRTRRKGARPGMRKKLLPSFYTVYARRAGVVLPEAACRTVDPDVLTMPGVGRMSTLTIRLPDDVVERLKQLAAARGVSLNQLMEELGTTALAAHDAETRFRAAAAGADRRKALAVLARLDAEDRRAAEQGSFWELSVPCGAAAPHPAWRLSPPDLPCRIKGGLGHRPKRVWAAAQ
jgi:plasmid stability protein